GLRWWERTPRYRDDRGSRIGSQATGADSESGSLLVCAEAHGIERAGIGLRPRLRRAVARQRVSPLSPLIAGDNRRRPFFPSGASEEGGARQRECNLAGRSRERPLPDAVAVATSACSALARIRPERGPQLLVHGRLDRDADV